MQSFLVETFLPLVIMAVVALAWIAWLIRLCLFFAYRIRDARQNKDNPLEGRETMGLPRGAVRTFLALMFTSVATLTLLAGESFVAAPDKKWVLGELGVIITFYFGSKAFETRADAQAKLKAIEKAGTAEEVGNILRLVPYPASGEEKLEPTR